MKVEPLELKKYLEEIGKEAKEHELRFSEYMEAEYQESDLDRGIKIVKNYMEMLSSDEEYEKYIQEDY